MIIPLKFICCKDFAMQGAQLKKGMVCHLNTDVRLHSDSARYNFFCTHKDMHYGNVPSRDKYFHFSFDIIQNYHKLNYLIIYQYESTK